MEIKDRVLVVEDDKRITTSGHWEVTMLYASAPVCATITS